MSSDVYRDLVVDIPVDDNEDILKCLLDNGVDDDVDEIVRMYYVQ